MRNAKLWSVLVAAVLLCACAFGMLFTGAGASDTRIPASTTTYEVGSHGNSIGECLNYASRETWEKDDVLEITFSGTDESAKVEADAANGRSSYLLFGQTTIFREDGSKLPIVIKGTSADAADKITTPKGSYSCANDYYFTNLTVVGGSKSNVVYIYAGSGNIVFENTKHTGMDDLYTYYYADNSNMDAFYGWSEENVAKHSNEQGLVETSVTFGKGAKIVSVASKKYFSAVGSSVTSQTIKDIASAATATTNKRLTDAQVQQAKSAALTVEYNTGDLLASDCIVKPSRTKASLILDAGTAKSTANEYGVIVARAGASPVAEAVVEILTGNTQYIDASGGSSTALAVHVGETKYVIRAGKTISGDTGMRFLKYAQHIGNFTVEIHEDDGENYPTDIAWIQGESNDDGFSCVYGDYHFLMTGGLVGRNSSKVGVKNRGYFGAPEATGQTVNEVRGGTVTYFYGYRYTKQFEPSTDFSVTLPDGKVIQGKADVRNVVSGGTIGDLNDTTAASRLGFCGGVRNADTTKASVVCNEISGGTIAATFIGNYTDIASETGSAIYNIISGSPVFKTAFNGSYMDGSLEKLTNVITGTPTFEKAAYLGIRLGTVSEIENYVYGGTFNGQVNGGSNGGKVTSSVKNVFAGGTFNGYVYGGSTSDAKGRDFTIQNDVIGGEYNGVYCGAGYRGAKSVVNNFYGGTMVKDNKFGGAYENNTDDAFDITNNFYGGIWGGKWAYGGNRTGPAGTITNNFYTGAENPKRNAANPSADMHENGTVFRDQYICGGGSQESGILKNSVTAIVNNFGGGCWTKSTGSTADIRIRTGMRIGNVGNLTNNFRSGTYYIIYGGCDRGFVTGTVTNNVGTSTAADKPELVITSQFNGVYNDFDFDPSMESAVEKKNAGSELTALESVYVELAEMDFVPYVNKVVNHFNYGTIKGEAAAGRVENSTGGRFLLNSAENYVKPGFVFESIFVGGLIHPNGKYSKVDTITNVLEGATIQGHYYGGSSGSGCVIGNITNTLKDMTFNQTTNKSIYMGGGNKATCIGTITSELTDVNAGRGYVHGGNNGKHDMPATADFAVVTTVNGGTYAGVWGVGGEDAVLNGNSKLIVQSGTFNGYDANFTYSVMGAGRNAKVNGNCVTEIYGGTFNALVTAGVAAANVQYAQAVNGDISLNIYGGEFYGKVNANGAYAGIVASGNATVTINAEDTLLIGKDTDITADVVTGILKVRQTEGWLAHDYLKLPATAQYEITESPEIFGSYVADDTILVKGAAIEAVGATLRLGERLGVRIVLNQADVEEYGEEFTYTVKLGDTKIASGTYADIVANGYSILFDGIGLGDFGTEFTVSTSVSEDMTYSIVALAELAQTAWKNDAKWKAYADAVIEFHNVYNLKKSNTMNPAAVEAVPTADKGDAGVNAASVTVLMGDAAGIRLTATLPEAPANARILVNGNEVTSSLIKVEEATITADLFFAHEALADTFVISVVSDAGEHMTYTASIEALANQLANDQNNVNRNNAIAFLCYVQKAVACK